MLNFFNPTVFRISSEIALLTAILYHQANDFDRTEICAILTFATFLLIGQLLYYLYSRKAKKNG